MFRLIVAGGRDFDNYAGLERSLDYLLKNVIDDVQIVCGMAKGADRLGERYAKEHGYEVRYFPADWDMDGKSAGFKRNVRMAENADALVAFWDGQSKGTKHMIDTAQRMGLEVRVKTYRQRNGRPSILTFHDGDLIVDSKVDVICHQTNCQSVMGAGIAKQIHKVYPRVFEQYQAFCADKRAHGMSPLGSCQLVYTDDTRTRIVANLFGQEYYGRDRQQTDYNALRNALRILAHNKFLRENKLTLGFPYLIGCSLGGGYWNVVQPMIEKELADYPGKIEIWRLNK